MDRTIEKMFSRKLWLCWKIGVQCVREINFFHSDITVVIILHCQIRISYNWRPYLSINPRRNTVSYIFSLCKLTRNIKQFAYSCHGWYVCRNIVTEFLFEWFYFFWVGFIVFFLACTRLGVYTVIIAGWSSNSGYSLLEDLRALAQTISYEVRLTFILLSFVVLVCRYNLAYFYFFHGISLSYLINILVGVKLV
jgi:NADH-ubiquinone oxidoreductase chain 1